MTSSLPTFCTAQAGRNTGFQAGNAVTPASRVINCRSALLTALFLLTALSSAFSQYNNEWIDHSRTYYKFKVGADGLYQISQTLLAQAGLGNADVRNLELWRNGKKVPIQPSVADGTLPSGGYIEFWGEKNDGAPDQILYRNPAYQHTAANSLFTDTAIYFLSVNTDQSGLFYNDPGNNVATSPLSVEPYFMHKAATYYKNGGVNPGFAVVVGEYVYSSSFDKGEFWASAVIRPTNPLTTTHSNLKVYAGGPDASLSFGAMGNALNERHVQVSVNSTLLKDTIMDLFTDIHTSVPVPLALITSGSAAVRFANTSANNSDRMVISYFELSYPRQFDFDNQQQFAFSLPASASGYKLHITNFNHGGVPPVLLDLTTGQRIVADISTPGTVQLVVGPGGTRDFVLVSRASSNIKSVTSLTPKTFVNYQEAARQGNYLIITNKALFTGTHGNNPIEDYKQYRSSDGGGGYQVTIVDVDDLVDQFAFGIKKNPLSVKNFLRYARNTFPIPIEYAFIIGRGMQYTDFNRNESQPMAEQLNLVPTFGYPASDNLLSAEGFTNPIAVTPIGRLSVVKAQEVEDYLEKIKEYENVQQTAAGTIAGREWMKNVMHVTGSTDPYLGTVLCNFMSVYGKMLQDTSFGANVSLFCKTSTNTVETINGEKIAALFEEGVSIMTYFGHSSSTTLEFSLDDPMAYNSQGKYPVFFVNGCKAGDYYTYNPARLQFNESLSEKFTLAKQRGSIAFVASTHFGMVNYLNIFLNNLYGLMSRIDYGKSLGITVRDGLQKMVATNGPNDYYARVHAEEISINGDPALKFNELPKPDYVIEEPQLRINPAFISVAENNFKMTARMVNIGRAVADSISVEVKRQYPDGTTEVLSHQKIRGIRYADSISLTIPIMATRDKGLNKITVTVDADDDVEEMSESNNSATKEIFIFEDEARAVYPYNYAIVNDPAQQLFASTADPFSASKEYILELDTTELFNSPAKVMRSLHAKGGLLSFDPGISYRDSTVYYWRVASKPAEGETFKWNNSSFRYINGPSEGFAQSHYFQHTHSEAERVSLEAGSREWEFGTRLNRIIVRNGMFPTAAPGESDLSISVNDETPIASACIGRSIIFHVFNPVTFKPWKNVDENNQNLFLSGSARANCNVSRHYNFEFSYLTHQSRNLMVKFLDSIPDGYYVIARSTDWNDPNSFSATWQGDTAIYGSNNSIYHRLFAEGFMDIDSINRAQVFTFVFQKGVRSFTPQYKVSEGVNDKILVTAMMSTPDTLGTMVSPVFGPARQWQEVLWQGNSKEASSDDNPSVDVIGIDNQNQEQVLYTLDRDTKQFDVSGVDAAQYPFMRLRMRNIDSVTLTPYQLSSWMVHYKPVPEGVLAPNVLLSVKDTLEIGEPLKFGIAFKNISKYDFDSLALKFNILDKDNVLHPVELPKLKPLIAGDTVSFQYDIDSKLYPGENTLFLEFNPNKDQPEQYQFNNFLYKNFYVRPDLVSPLLDVTFDGVHILNKDLVSAKPHIRIRLQDDARFLLLNDTALSTVQLRYPDGTVRTYHFDNDTLRFTAAANSEDNVAVVDFYPHFTNQYNPEGDEYELIVRARDRSGNKAGETEYRVAFTVITKAMISNLLNYPNPFTTATAFVFTITGSEIPQNLKIQILTVTGKVVREITKDELGPLRIGRNITEFKWDGTDQFGQRLANGVYLYRFVSTLNGRRMEKYTARGDNTDMYFNNGYGKMYLMR